MLDANTGLPLPPIEARFNSEAALWVSLVFGAILLVALVYAVKDWRETKRPMLLFLLLASATAVLAEPFLDVVGAAFHPVIGQNVAFAMLGRPIPWWCVICYTAFFGALGMFNFKMLGRGVSMRVVWLMILAPVAIDIVMEEMMMAFDLYLYYGRQPLILLWKFPLWWAPANALGQFLGIALIVKIIPRLKGLGYLVVPLIFPIGDAVGYMVVGLPAIYAINTPDLPDWLIALAGLGVYLLTGIATHGLALMLGTDSPWRRAPHRLESESQAAQPI